LIEVRDEILDVLDADRQAHRIVGDPGQGQFVGRQLTMGANTKWLRA
jgi:hypothetical protein